jgi:hypothetical protein
MTAAEFMTCATRVYHTGAISPDTPNLGYNPASRNHKAWTLVSSVARHINPHDHPYNFHGTV